MPESWFRAFRNDSMKVGGFGSRVAVQASFALSQVSSREKFLGSLVGKYDSRIPADEQYAFIEATEGCDRGDLKKFSPGQFDIDLHSPPQMRGQQSVKCDVMLVELSPPVQRHHALSSHFDQNNGVEKGFDLLR